MAQIAEIIKYEGDNSTFIWKHPCEDFNSLTQLIVHESQEAIFLMNGQALDTFGAGRYTLETQNIPKLGKFLNRATGDASPFHCEVYFINQTVQMGIKWGTDSKVRYIDPDSGIPLELGACGEMNMQVSDSRKLLIKLVGTMNGIAWGDNGAGFTKSIQNSFRPLISTMVKSNLTTAIKEKGINVLEVDEHLEELSKVLQNKLVPGFEEYGLTIPQFFITTIVLPEDNPNFKRLKELQTVTLQTRMAKAEAAVRMAQAQAEADVTAARRQVELEKQTTETEIAKREAERKVIEAQAEAQAKRMEGLTEAEIMQAKGYSQKDVLEAEVQKAYAEGIGNLGANAVPGGTGGSGGGNIATDMVGMMAGMKMAETMMGKMDGIFGNKETAKTDASAEAKAQTIKCPACDAELPIKAKFCLLCGQKIETLAENEMICPTCGMKTPKGKFCMECGASLIKKCAKCGAELQIGAKFCFECGEKV